MHHMRPHPDEEFIHFWQVTISRWPAELEKLKDHQKWMNKQKKKQKQKETTNYNFMQKKTYGYFNISLYESPNKHHPAHTSI